jgi:flagellar M-ring protein FliF
MGGLLLRLRTWWETADRTQKAVTVFGGIFLAVLLLGTFYFASKPKLETAFRGLTEAEVGAITAELKKQGINYDFDQNGNIRMPKDKITQFRADLATANKLPTSAGSSSADLKDMSAWTTPSVERERLKGILEGQISESIKCIEGVESARVQITPSTDSAFASEKKVATASVTLIEKANSHLGGEQAKSIAQLVAFSTPGLDVNHVSIVNQTGTLLWDGSSQGSSVGTADKKLTAEINESKRREREVQSALDGVFGAGTTIAKVNVTLDFDTKSIESTLPVTNENPAQVDKGTEEMTGGGPQSTSQIGAPQNASAQNKDGKNYKNERNTSQYAVGQTQTKVEQAAGTLTGMSITVIADSEKIKDKTALEETLNGYLATPMRPEDSQNFKATVSMVAFDKTGQLELKKAAAAGAMTGKIQQGLSILPIVALLLVGFIVVKAIGKAAKEQNILVQALPDGRMIPMRASMNMSGSTDIVSADEMSEEGQPAAPKKKPEIGEIPDKVDIPLEQIKKMSSERPEAVAMLIKSWLLEDKR